MSTRKQPFIGFDSLREAGNDLLSVKGLTKSLNGEVILKDISFNVKKGDKIVLLGRSDLAKTMLLNILAGEVEPDAGSFTWGVTTLRSYFPTDNSKYFNSELSTLVDWLRQYSQEKDESFIRGFLGKVLFSRSDSEVSRRVYRARLKNVTGRNQRGYRKSKKLLENKLRLLNVSSMSLGRHPVPEFTMRLAIA